MVLDRTGDCIRLISVAIHQATEYIVRRNKLKKNGEVHGISEFTERYR